MAMKKRDLIVLDDEKHSGWIAYDIVWDAITQPEDLPTKVLFLEEMTQYEIEYLEKEYGMKVYSIGIKPFDRTERPEGTGGDGDAKVIAFPKNE